MLNQSKSKKHSLYFKYSTQEIESTTVAVTVAHTCMIYLRDKNNLEVYCHIN